MRKCTERFSKSVLFAAAAASVGYTFGASATTTFYAYDATTFATAPDPTSADGGSWQNVTGGTAAALSAIGFGSGSGPDGNYWQISDAVTNASKGYGIASPAPPASTFTDPNG